MSDQPTARGRITLPIVKNLVPPPAGNRITWDAEVTGFGVRITAGGAVAFVLRYVFQGRERIITIGRFPDLSPTAAREHAIRMRGEIIAGRDPLTSRTTARDAPSVADMCDDYLDRHAKAKKRGWSRYNDERHIKRFIKPKLGPLKVLAVTRRDIDTLHHSLQNTPYQANRVLALLSKMFSLAFSWGWRADNPCKGIERFNEQKRERWLSTEEVDRLSGALNDQPNQRAANAFRLLLLTGARRGEVLSATWDQFDLEHGIWTKPSSHTKNKREHVVPLNAPALALLSEMHAAAKRDNMPSLFLFPGDADGKPLQDVKRAWEKITQDAGLGCMVEKTKNGKVIKDEHGKPVTEWRSNARIHDLRHTFASHLASGGLSLPLIGRLLGHTQQATTQRYAHLAIDPLREAANRFGAMVAGGEKGKRRANVVSHPRAKSAQRA